MITRIWVAAVALALCGCVSNTQPPVADMQGVDLVQYNRDLAYCEHNQPFFRLETRTQTA